MSLHRVFIALVVGVLITVAISWCAMFLPAGNNWYGPPAVVEVGLTKTSDDSRIFYLSRGSNAWHNVISYWWMQISGRSFMIPIEDYESRRIDLDSLPSHLRPESVDELVMQSWYHETGWPFAAMTCSVHWKEQILNANVIYTVRGGLQLSRDKEFNPRALPLAPLWPGFLLNVLIWGGAWFTLISFAQVLRVRVRSRQGRCVHCGYQRTGLPPNSRCPECGKIQRI